MESSDLTPFLRKVGRLKQEPRRGWVAKAHLRRPETVAAHTFRTAVAAYLMALRRGLDPEHACTLALFHDLPEAVTGDRMPEEQPRSRRRDEDAAVKTLTAMLPRRLGARIEALWREWRAGHSAEARLVRELDRFELGLQAAEYAEGGVSWRRLREFYAAALDGVRDPLLKAWLRELG